MRVSAKELARRLNDYLGRVRHRRESFLIERNSRPVARIVPVEGTEPVTVARAFAAWCSAPPADSGFVDDLARVNAAGVPDRKLN